MVERARVGVEEQREGGAEPVLGGGAQRRVAGGEIERQQAVLPAGGRQQRLGAAVLDVAEQRLVAADRAVAQIDHRLEHRPQVERIYGSEPRHRAIQPPYDHRVATGYSGTPLARKLGIKPGHRVALLGAPESLALPELPEDVRIVRRAGGQADVIVSFHVGPRGLRAPAPVPAGDDAAGVRALDRLAQARVEGRRPT